MPHVTFIHGISNKPAPEVLLRLWRDGLAVDLEGSEGLDLGAQGVTSSMVYWADVLNEQPQEEMADHESTDTIVQRDEPDPDLRWRETLGDQEKRWVDQLAGRLGFDASAPGGNEDYESPPEQMTGATHFERIPLPWWAKRRLMKALLRDVHHYLFNAGHSPRPGETYRVQDEIRRRMIAALEEGARKPSPHLVVSHSMGTVIAYDCLKRVANCPRIAGLLTIGSPLGLDEVQDKLAPEWSRHDGFPSARLLGSWVNVFDRLDPVAGFDAEFRNDYQRGGQVVIDDVHEQNFGSWRHSITKYLGGQKLRHCFGDLLRL